MQGKIIKGIAGFYYVQTKNGIYECKAKGSFRNRKLKPFVGDNVEITVLDEENKKGNMEKILERKNFLIRPAVANVDQTLVIFAAAKPDPNLNLLDRFLIMMEQKSVPVVLVFNKSDVAEHEKLVQLAKIYEDCGYQVLKVSALQEEGISEIKEILKGKTSTVAGPSGVGKSSIINRFVGANRMIVSSMAGTTRDSVDTTVENEFGTFTFIDTAGIRRQNKVKEETVSEETAEKETAAEATETKQLEEKLAKVSLYRQGMRSSQTYLC